MRVLLITILFINVLFAHVCIVSAVNGEVFIKKNNQLIPIHLGDKLNKTDTIITKNGILQIIFKDKTAITIGKNSNFSIQKYIFDTKNKKNNIAKFSTTKGLFKIITGKIGELNPKKFKVKTPNSTIGIRGTIIVLHTTPKLDKVACLGGKIIVYSNYTHKYVIINPGYMTMVKPHKSPEKPKPVVKIEIPKTTTKKEKYKNQYKLSTPIEEAIQENNNANKINNTKVEYLYKSSSLSYGYYLDKNNKPTDIWLKGSKAPSYLLNLIFSSNIKATYTGKAGAIFNNEKLVGNIKATIDFDKKTINGNLDLQNDKKWKFDFSSKVYEHGFDTSLVSDKTSEVKGEGSIDGKFYNKGDKIGGHFNINTDSGTAKGVYGAATSIKNIR